MTVRELNREQLIQLKQKFIDGKCLEEDGIGASFEELANADILISDEEITSEYEGHNFTEDDFFNYSIER